MEEIDTVILAGGLGTRFSEKTKNIPKPMIKIGNEPIIMHIIKKYMLAGCKRFIITTGYKYHEINNFFRKKSKSLKKLKNKSFIYDLTINKKKIIIKTVYTGYNTFTGTRILKAKDFIESDRFFLTYGDGLSNVDIKKLLKFHIKKNKIGTVTSVRPPARFGELVINNGRVMSFKEKPQLNDGWINGGFFVFERKFLNLIDKRNNVMLERQPLEAITKTKNFVAFQHKGFWQCMDTLRDYNILKKLNTQDAPWKK